MVHFLSSQICVSSKTRHFHQISLWWWEYHLFSRELYLEDAILEISHAPCLQGNSDQSLQSQHIGGLMIYHVTQILPGPSFIAQDNKNQSWQTRCTMYIVHTCIYMASLIFSSIFNSFYLFLNTIQIYYVHLWNQTKFNILCQILVILKSRETFFNLPKGDQNNFVNYTTIIFNL